MKILNIGCGVKTSNDPRVINIDWSIYLQIKKSALLKLVAKPFLTGTRRERFESIPDSIMVHDLRKGLPFEENSIDVVYHSHFLEHLSTTDATGFLLEVKRVLKPGGVHRIVVPDMEFLCRRYLEHVALCSDQESSISAHDAYISDIIEQMVRLESFGSSQQPRLRRFIENLLLGDARKRGEIHQWMYDRFNLRHKLESVGYQAVTVHTHNSSHIKDWAVIGLDLNSHGEEYKPGSLYIEAFKEPALSTDGLAVLQLESRKDCLKQSSV